MQGRNGNPILNPLDAATGCRFDPGGVLAAGQIVEIVGPDEAGEKLEVWASFQSLVPPMAGDVIQIPIPPTIAGADWKVSSPFAVLERWFVPNPKNPAGQVCRCIVSAAITPKPTTNGQNRVFDGREWMMVELYETTDQGWQYWSEIGLKPVPESWVQFAPVRASLLGAVALCNGVDGATAREPSS